jgi:hypothetical protein
MDFLQQLKIKHKPNVEKSFVINIKPKKDIENDDENLFKIIEEQEIEVIQEHEQIPVPTEQKNKPVKIVDKRKDVLINRNEILEKILNKQKILNTKKIDDTEIEILKPSFKIIKQNKNIIISDKKIEEQEEREEPTKEREEPKKEEEKEEEKPKKEQEKKEEIKEKPKRGRPKKVVVKEPLEKEQAEVIKIKAKKIKIIQEEPEKEQEIEPVFTNIKIGDIDLDERIPKKEKLIMKTSNFYMNNRKLFIDKITKLFEPYKKEIEDKTENISCDAPTTENIDFKLLTHQKLVREYLNLYTPYRGLLLYHSLGSGKTCSSIAIAEGMKTEKQIYLLTPASLKMNFFSELKKCGDELYKKNQFWEFISIEGNHEYENILSTVLSLPKEYIKKNKGAWLVNIKNPTPNFSSLSPEEQKQIDEQLNKQIRSKYTDLNYNGLNKNIINRLTRDMTINPFDNSVIIIDEAHNFVSRIVNKIKKPTSISYILYDLLMKATNARIILISGTPIINYPNEIGILFNILRGYIETWIMDLNVKTEKKINKEEILKLFEKSGINTYDYVEYSGNKLTITRNPFGFVNTKKNEKINKKEIKKGGKKTKKNKPVRAYKRKTEKIKDNIIKNSEIDIVENPLTEEEKIDNYNNWTAHNVYKGGNYFTEYDGVRLDDGGNITSEEFINKVKEILNKNHLEVVNEQKVFHKALPDDAETFKNVFINTEKLTINASNINLFKKRILGLTSYFRSSQEKLLPQYVKTEQNELYHIIPVEMSDYQFMKYASIRVDEIKVEENQKKNKKKNDEDIITKDNSTYRIFSRACCNFAFPDPPGRPMPDNRKKNADENGLIDEDEFNAVPNNQLLETNDYIDEEDIEIIKEPETTYLKRIEAALEMLKYNPEKTEEEQYLSVDGLQKYSPKFLKILENIKSEENKGNHLLYTQFRTIEGIGILKLILEANGYSQFKIKKNGDNWEIVETEDEIGKPKFVLYTGTETAEEKEIIRNVYNSNWGFIPNTIRDELVKKSSNNFYGEIIKLIMITSSGAEGINLKNTRFVHLTEPYWNDVRLQQVIGRAARICSHVDLPEELRTVKVFLYLTVFSTKQIEDKKNNREVMNKDISRLSKKPITTDENLYEISTIKNKLNQQLLKAVKETSIDCSIYSKGENEDKLVCYNFGVVSSNNFSSYPSIEQDKSVKEDLNVKEEKLMLKEVVINDIKYAYNTKTGEIYDFKTYENKEVLKAIGIIKGKKVEFY